MLTNALLDTHHGVTRYDRATRKLTHGTFPGLRVDGLGVAMQVLGDRAEDLGQLCVMGDAPEKQETGKKTIPQVREFLKGF
ncbi:hypothetical protein [Corynebacterium sp. CQ3829_602738]